MTLSSLARTTWCALIGLVATTSAAAQTPAPQPTEPPAPISDNSFLVEEA